MTTPEEAAEFEAVKKEILRRILSKEALERLSRVKLANPLLASQLEAYLVQVYQTGQLQDVVDDAKLKQILNVLQPQKKTKIKRR